MFSCNKVCDKLPPLIIGKSKRPRWIKDVKDFMDSIVYESSPKAWMNKKIFENWLSSLDKNFIAQNRKILMILDNASCHLIPHKFKNIELIFLPKNTTSKVQPLDQGIIRSFKNKYKKYFLRKITFCNENIPSYKIGKKFKISDCIPLIIRSWNEISQNTIVNCF
ncbi:Tigger transposable element-derived protein 4 [Dictyocoela muelleri]|nr:Tigger transposable element-derived protein 4 [Dictyocoela muelleri]